jgi:hypothetical protein
MPDTLSRKTLNILNMVTAQIGLRILSSADYQMLREQPVQEQLRIQSSFVALAGTLTAFGGYLQMRTEEDSNKAMASTAEFLQHPETLANRVRAVAKKLSDPIDRFMTYYSDHFRECNSQWSQDVFVSYMLGRKENGVFIQGDCAMLGNMRNLGTAF